jgi:hypothetical protein
MPTHEEIVEMLNREVKSASRRLAEARRVFDALIADVSGELPYLVQEFRTADAAWEHRQAREALQLAITRHSDFMLDGIIPEDLESQA